MLDPLLPAQLPGDLFLAGELLSPHLTHHLQRVQPPDHSPWQNPKSTMTSIHGLKILFSTLRNMTCFLRIPSLRRFKCHSGIINHRANA
jgi:hypothetical protein